MRKGYLYVLIHRFQYISHFFLDARCSVVRSAVIYTEVDIVIITKRQQSLNVDGLFAASLEYFLTIRLHYSLGNKEISKHIYIFEIL